MKSLSPLTRSTIPRRGLAPLELVLSLPLLLMIMAMIIIVGTAGSWKVRTLANSRQATARSLWPRDGAFDAKPASWWPNSATMRFQSAGTPALGYDPFKPPHDVVRGPSISSPGGNSLRVNDELLDMDVGLALVQGEASINRDLPLWKQLPYRNQYHRWTQVYAGNQWQFQSMGLGSNESRRVYDLYPDYSLGNYGGTARTMAARDALIAFRNSGRLNVLDREVGDVHPRLSWETCTVDLQPTVLYLTGQISQVPCELARRFQRQYSPMSPEYTQLQQFIDEHCH